MSLMLQRRYSFFAIAFIRPLYALGTNDRRLYATFLSIMSKLRYRKSHGAFAALLKIFRAMKVTAK